MKPVEDQFYSLSVRNNVRPTGPASIILMVHAPTRERTHRSSSRGDVDVLAGPLSWTDPGVFEVLVSEESAHTQAEGHDSWN
jgi:hypothetical protein